MFSIFLRNFGFSGFLMDFRFLPFIFPFLYLLLFLLLLLTLIVKYLQCCTSEVFFFSFTQNCKITFFLEIWIFFLQKFLEFSWFEEFGNVKWPINRVLANEESLWDNSIKWQILVLKFDRPNSNKFSWNAKNIPLSCVAFFSSPRHFMVNSMQFWSPKGCPMFPERLSMEVVD